LAYYAEINDGIFRLALDEGYDERGRSAVQGVAVQVEPMKHVLKAPGIKRLKLKYDYTDRPSAPAQN
jgi:hypothetical protein